MNCLNQAGQEVRSHHAPGNQGHIVSETKLLANTQLKRWSRQHFINLQDSYHFMTKSSRQELNYYALRLLGIT